MCQQKSDKQNTAMICESPVCEGGDVQKSPANLLYNTNVCHTIIVAGSMAKRNLIKKICLIGDGAVGKTSLIRKYVYDEFDDKYLATIGAKVTKKVIDIENEYGDEIHLSIMIHDILGQARFENVHKQYYKGAEGGFLVIDLTRKDTLKKIRWWYSGFTDVVGKVPLTLLGNKNDLKDEHEITSQELWKAAMDMGCPHYATSAKNGENVERVFENMAKRLCK